MLFAQVLPQIGYFLSIYIYADKCVYGDEGNELC